MPTLNDAKYAALETLTGLSLQIDDMEKVWLDSLDPATRAQWMNPSTRYDLLVAEGYSGTLNDMQYAFWVAGGTFGGIPANAILDRNGDPILDRNGNYIITRP